MTRSTTPQDARHGTQAPQTTYPLVLSLIDALRDDTPRTIGSLAESFDVPRRKIEAAVQQLRNSGYPIATGPRGVWRATSLSELEQQYREQRERALTVLKGCHGLREAMKKYQEQPVQIGMFEEAA